MSLPVNPTCYRFRREHGLERHGRTDTSVLDGLQATFSSFWHISGNIIHLQRNCFFWCASGSRYRSFRVLLMTRDFFSHGRSRKEHNFRQANLTEVYRSSSDDYRKTVCSRPLIISSASARISSITCLTLLMESIKPASSPYESDALSISPAARA